MNDPFWPNFMFLDYIGPTRTWFAWHPVRIWSGEIVWLQKVHCRVAVANKLTGVHEGITHWIYTR